MKRFYKDVTVVPTERTDAYGVRLDTRPVRTPLRNELVVPGGALADAIAGEWRAQEEKIDVEAMPMTRIAATALDRVAADRPAYVDRIAAYAETDLVCYRAPAPTSLVVRQSRAWEPLIEWARETFDAELVATEGLLPVDQPAESLGRLRDAVDAHDHFELAALGVMVAACGSVVVALALSHGHLDAATAVAVSQLDESYQEEVWGADAEASRRRAALKDEIACAATFLELLRAG